eukprot:jgi/Psemu1/42773/gm1.42773_g
MFAFSNIASLATLGLTWAASGVHAAKESLSSTYTSRCSLHSVRRNRYEADGAHARVDELEPGIAPGDSNCTETLSCPAPMYYMAREYTGVYSNIQHLVPIPKNVRRFWSRCRRADVFIVGRCRYGRSSPL